MDQAEVQSVHSGNNNNMQRYHYISVNNKRGWKANQNELFRSDKSESRG